MSVRLSFSVHCVMQMCPAKNWNTMIDLSLVSVAPAWRSTSHMVSKRKELRLEGYFFRVDAKRARVSPDSKWKPLPMDTYNIICNCIVGVFWEGEEGEGNVGKAKPLITSHQIKHGSTNSSNSSWLSVIFVMSWHLSNLCRPIQQQRKLMHGFIWSTIKYASFTIITRCCSLLLDF